MSLRFGVTLPTFTWPNLDYKKTATVVRDFARRSEELGFASLTVWDHLTDAPGLYGGSWLDPLLCLSHAAACTKDIRLGTHILVVPLRHPVLLAKEIATLDYVCEGRFFFGVGSGWSKPEFDAMGIDLSERGRRTDEILDAVRLLLTRKNASFEGEFYHFRDVTIDPRPPRFPEVWIAGGSRIPDLLSPDKPYMVKTVLKRIAKHADVFTCRASGNQELVKRDFQTVRDYLSSVGRDSSTLGLAQVQAIYAVDTDDPEEALRIQRPHFETMMGTHRSWEHVQECYMVGTIKKIVDRLKDLENSGLQHVTLQPTSPELVQLELWAEKILPHFRQLKEGKVVSVLEFSVVHKDGQRHLLEFSVRRLLLAGFTARNQEGAMRHVEELRSHGVAAPDRIPAYYPVPRDLVTTDGEIEVLGTSTSGEVEVVFLFQGGTIYVGVGSDHTDRELEKGSIAKSKVMCPKIISKELWIYEDIKGGWDGIILRSWIGEGGRRKLYQEASLSDFLPSEELIRQASKKVKDSDLEGMVLYLGTTPTLEKSLLFPGVFEGELADASLGRSLGFCYSIRPIAWLS